MLRLSRAMLAIRYFDANRTLPGIRLQYGFPLPASQERGRSQVLTIFATLTPVAGTSSYNVTNRAGSNADICHLDVEVGKLRAQQFSVRFQFSIIDSSRPDAESSADRPTEHVIDFLILDIPFVQPTSSSPHHFLDIERRFPFCLSRGLPIGFTSFAGVIRWWRLFDSRRLFFPQRKAGLATRSGLAEISSAGRFTCIIAFCFSFSAA